MIQGLITLLLSIFNSVLSFLPDYNPSTLTTLNNLWDTWWGAMEGTTIFLDWTVFIFLVQIVIASEGGLFILRVLRLFVRIITLGKLNI